MKAACSGVGDDRDHAAADEDFVAVAENAAERIVADDAQDRQPVGLIEWRRRLADFDDEVRFSRPLVGMAVLNGDNVGHLQRPLPFRRVGASSSSSSSSAMAGVFSAGASRSTAS